jgi:hypothetical protein
MNGLDLDLYLKVVQVDRSTLIVVAVALSVLGIGIWAGFGSRKLLRKCLILSVVSHILIVRYGQPMQWARASLGNGLGTDAANTREVPEPLEPGIRSLEIVDIQNSGSNPLGDRGGAGRGTGQGGGGVLPAELPEALPDIDSRPELASRPQSEPSKEALPERVRRDNIDLPNAEIAETIPVESMKPERAAEAIPKPDDIVGSPIPKANAPLALLDQERKVLPETTKASPRPAPTAPLALPESAPRIVRPETSQETGAMAAPAMTRPGTRESVPLPKAEIGAGDTASTIRRELPKRTETIASASRPGNAMTAINPATIPPAEELAPPVPFLSESDAASNSGEGTPKSAGMLAANSGTNRETSLPDTTLRDRIRNRDPNGMTKPAAPERTSPREALALPKPDLTTLPPLALATGRSGLTGNRPLADIPAPYRSRLAPDKARLALQAGASTQSERSVEMALEWLRKHQDADGRWDGGVAKFRDGSVAPDEDSFTIHCPPGEVCYGECFYWEADTALTGLSLLAYLGAGYTHTQGKYADTVARGLNFLITSQKADGDMRGRSLAVGMYCHSMATLALCEAYALTGDDRLKQPAAKAVRFLIAAQAEGGAAWRYEPRAPVGDTSILGWAVLALKSGKAIGFPVPDDCIGGIQAWLDGVGSGKSGGLAKYQPWKEVTPTMTAEAWVCRWFLQLDPNPNRNREAADHLFEHGPDRDPYNLYYWYYGTLGMFQQGGDDWNRWNSLVRDRIVKRQKTTGHMAGSWDPDDSQWGTYGGRIYCTALATMTLEVYYRFLRTYDETEPTPDATR